MLRLRLRSVREKESNVETSSQKVSTLAESRRAASVLVAVRATCERSSRLAAHSRSRANTFLATLSTRPFFLVVPMVFCVRQCLLRYFLLFKNLLAFRDAVKVELLNISLD